MVNVPLDKTSTASSSAPVSVAKRIEARRVMGLAMVVHETLRDRTKA
jgi:hypothetical protein